MLIYTLSDIAILRQHLALLFKAAARHKHMV